MTIMIVDDHAEMRDLLKNFILLRLSDATRFIECESGESALQCYGQHRPDCVLMDFELEGLNGLETSVQLQQADQQVHIIMITAFNNHALRTRVREIQIKGLVSKDNLSALLPIISGIQNQHN